MGQRLLERFLAERPDSGFGVARTPARGEAVRTSTAWLQLGTPVSGPVAADLREEKRALIRDIHGHLTIAIQLAARTYLLGPL